MRAETRHQLKQDKFSKATIQVAEQTLDWSAEHKGKLLIGAIVAVIAICGGLGLWYYLQTQDEKASVEFTKAVQVLNEPIRPAGMPAQPDSPSFASLKERATEAHKQFAAVARDYPHTHAADFASYLMGVSSAQGEDYAVAERELKPVTESHNSEVASLAKLALASVYRNTNRTKDALDIYKQLIQSPTSSVSKSTAQVQLAQAYEAAGMNTEAKQQYEQLKKDAPAQSPAAQLAAEKLQTLK